jgi:polyisoprenoid-binding protein YceI
MRTFFIPLLFAIACTANAADSLILSVDQAHSQVDVAVKATMDSFTAHLENYTASIAVDPETRRPVSATVSFKFADVKTGKTARDEEMHKWQETAKFPDASFVMTAFTAANDGRYTASGTLQLHGVSLAISFPVSLRSDGVLWAIDGDAPLDTRDFGLPVFKKFGLLKVSPDLKVRFHIQGTLAAKPTATPTAP